MARDNPEPALSQTPNACPRADDPCTMCRGIAGLRVLDSEELLAGQRELFIIHSGQIYRLLRTRNDKLILQK